MLSKRSEHSDSETPSTPLGDVATTASNDLALVAAFPPECPACKSDDRLFGPEIDAKAISGVLPGTATTFSRVVWRRVCCLKCDRGRVERAHFEEVGRGDH